RPRADRAHVGVREAHGAAALSERSCAAPGPMYGARAAQRASMGGMPQAIRAGVTLEGVSRALASYTPRTLDIPGFRRAAVLVPLIDDGGHLSLLLTVRSATLRSHAGQVALPGGRLEPGEDSVDAALRETREEVGLVVPREAVLGELSDHPSPAGHVARPVVAGV